MSDAVDRLNAALEGRYAIERKLGEGGMATVYLAHARRFLTLLLLSLAACGGAESPTETTDTPVATTVTLSATTLSFSSVGATQQLAATVQDQNGATISGASVTWMSSSSSVASVSSTGLVEAIADGTTTVTATSGSATGTASVAVEQVAASLTLSPSPLFLTAPGATEFVTASVLDALGEGIASPTLTWTSNDESIATVSPTGLVAGKAVGTTTVEVEATKGGQTVTQGTSVTVSTLLGTIEWPFPGPLARTTLPGLVVVEAFYNGFFNAAPCDNANTTLAEVSMPWNSSGITHRYHAVNDAAFLGFTQCMVNGADESIAVGVNDVSSWGVVESIALDTGVPDLAGNTIDFIDLVVDDINMSGVAPNLTVVIAMRWLFYGH